MFLVNSYLSFKCHPTQKDAYLLTQFIVLTQGCALSRVIGPAMPSRELLAAAAEMTEALRSRYSFVFISSLFCHFVKN
jgi:hypothetical protein